MSAYAADTDTCETKSGYELYTCRVDKICSIGEYTNLKPVFKSEDFLEASEYLGDTTVDQNSAYKVLEEVKKQYRSNIGTIYSCAMIQAQTNGLNLIDEKLVKFEESWKLDDVIGNRVTARKTKLKAASDVLECITSDSETIFNKQNILQETTHQACSYVTYLEYLKQYYSSIPNILWVNGDNEASAWDTEKQRIEKEGRENIIQEYSTSQISQLISNVDNTIDREIEHTYKIFPIAFQAYTEYENSYPLHFLLEVIREDFVLLRRSIHAALMPIAQVGYKIINAMIH